MPERYDIRGQNLPDGNKVLSPKDIYNLNKNFETVGLEVFGNADFTKKIDKKIDNLAETITSRVGGIEENYSTKTQTADAINLAVVDKADRSEIEQTATDLTLKFGSVGSKNLIKNSGFLGGLNGWNTDSVDIISESALDTPSKQILKIPGTLNMSKRALQTISTGFDENCKKWTMSAFVANWCGTIGTTNPFVDIQLRTIYTDNTSDYFFLADNVKTAYAIRNIKKTITTSETKKVSRFELSIYCRDMGGGDLWVGCLTLEEGQVAHSWSNADNEAYETTFKFNALGFEMKDANGGVLIEASKGIANEQNFGRTENVESGYPLNMSFEIGDSTSLITSVKLKLKQYNFRTDSKGAASGGGSTSGASSRSTSDEKWTGQGLSGVTVSQTNGVVGDTHNHAIGFNQFGHSHGMAHTHSTPAHVHPIDFGILETTNTNGTIDVYIDGVWRTKTTNTDTTLDITTWVTTNGVHSLRLESPNMKRIQCDVFIKSYIRR